ncbi:hypothetical protein ACI2L4_33650 [Streptomyces sparsogenes]|uniref:hypothetical protein n=1 Tax=Streptomyces sparsogenes TaxID=67365 RepID=UPI00384A4DC4
MERSLRAARVATYAYFVLYGTLLGTWVVHIPALEERVGISHAALGGLLVVLGPGAFGDMQVAGPLADRLGTTRVVVPAGGVLAAGHADPSAAGANVSRVAGPGYVGMLAGPAVIGWLTHLVALDHAFVLLTPPCVTTAVGARVLRTGPDLIRQAGTETAAGRTRRPETAADHPRRCEMAAGDH